jgi:hypothetical protein
MKYSSTYPASEFSLLPYPYSLTSLHMSNTGTRCRSVSPNYRGTPALVQFRKTNEYALLALGYLDG